MELVNWETNIGKTIKLLLGLLKMEAANSPQMLEIIYQSTYSHISQGVNYQHRCENQEHHILNSFHQSSELHASDQA
jgi:hypothetical protein